MQYGHPALSPAKDLADLLISFFPEFGFLPGRIVLKKTQSRAQTPGGYAHAVNRLYATIGIKHIIALLREMFQILGNYFAGEVKRINPISHNIRWNNPGH